MTARQWFINRPIHAKLNLINILVVLAALIPIVGITLGFEYYSVRKASVNEAKIQADIIRDNVAAAMAFADADSANEILQALHSSPSIIQAALLLPDKTVFARYIKPETSPAAIAINIDKDKATVEEGTIRISRHVFLKRDAVGWLVTETSMSALHERLRLYLLVNLIATVIGFAIAYPLSTRLKESITGPLSDLMALARHVTTHQDYSHPRAPSHSRDEIGSLSRAFDRMLTNIQERDLKLNQMAYYDAVTGLTNRHYFMERLDQTIANAIRYGTRSCLMFIDLDDFKIVNDTHGHHVGDELLRAVAFRLTAVLRDNDIVCRLGGDEFAVIIDNIKDLKGASVLAQKIITNLSEPMSLHGNDIVVGASIGFSACPDHAQNTADLLRAADSAMYAAKAQGKNRFSIYYPNPPELEERM